MRVAQINFFPDPLRREPDELLTEWQTIGLVARAAASAGHDVVVFQAAHQDAERGAGDARIRFIQERWTRRFPIRLVEEAVSFAPDVIHVHGLSFPRETLAMWARAPRTPILGQDHFNKPPSGWRRPIHRLALSRLAGAAFTARELAEPFVRTGLLSRSLRVFEVVEGTTTFTPGDIAAARVRTGIFGEPCVLSVANLDPRKDPVTVLDAFRRASSVLPDARLWLLYRSGELLGSVQRRIEADPILRERVRLLGERPHAEIEHYHRAADLFLSASRSEGSGYALIESIACGCTPILGDIPPFRRITGDGRIGALVPLGDAEAMSRALVELGRSPGEELRRRARAHFEQELSIEAMGRQLGEAYRAIARKREAP